MRHLEAANDNMLDRTLAVWQPRSRASLTREDARQMVENTAGFFRILAEWARSEPSAANDDKDTTLGGAS